MAVLDLESTLIQDETQKTIKLTFRRLYSPAFSRLQWRYLKTMGDHLLCENVATGILKRKRYTAINDSDHAEERWALAKKAIKDITKMLRDGYLIDEPEPGTETQVDYCKFTFLEMMDWAIEKKKLEIGTLQTKDYKTLRNHLSNFLDDRKIKGNSFQKGRL